MSLEEVIKKRYSCRSYDEDRPIETEKMSRIFDLAKLAPSAKNTQDWRFVVVTDKDKKSQVANCANRPEIFEKAGAIIAACSNSDNVMTCGQAIGPIDIAIVLDHISLIATDLGLGTCWIGSFKPDKVKTILSIPENIAVIELMAIGYPVGEGKHTPREPVEKVVCYNEWGF